MYYDRLKKRVKALKEVRNGQKIERPLYDCIIDDEHMALTALDYAHMLLEGHNGSMGGQCGVVYEELEHDNRPLHEKIAEVKAEIEKYCDFFNSPEEVAKREAEYAELHRIGELRKWDFYCGRNMDECHPLPW